MMELKQQISKPNRLFIILSLTVLVVIGQCGTLINARYANDGEERITGFKRFYIPDSVNHYYPRPQPRVYQQEQPSSFDMEYELSKADKEVEIALKNALMKRMMSPDAYFYDRSKKLCSINKIVKCLTMIGVRMINRNHPFPQECCKLPFFSLVGACRHNQMRTTQAPTTSTTMKPNMTTTMGPTTSTTHMPSTSTTRMASTSTTQMPNTTTTYMPSTTTTYIPSTTTTMKPNMTTTTQIPASTSVPRRHIPPYWRFPKLSYPRAARKHIISTKKPEFTTTTMEPDTDSPNDYVKPTIRSKKSHHKKHYQYSNEYTSLF